MGPQRHQLGFLEVQAKRESEAVNRATREMTR